MRFPVFAAAIASAAVLFACPLRPAYAQQPVPAAPKATARATWDENFVYFVVQVDDADVLGTHASPLSDVALDDSVGVYFQTGAAMPAAPNSATHAMLVSAAGGFTFLEGDAAKQSLQTKPLFSIKYGVTLQGTLNRSEDRDRGYVVSLAVPLSALGLDGKTLAAGTEVGFNLVVRGRSFSPGGTPPVSLGSLAPGVVSDADAQNPAKWIRLQFAAPDASASAAAGVTVAPRVVEKGTPPLIDGTFRPSNWPDASRLTVALPEPAAAPVAAVVPAPPPVSTPDPAVSTVLNRAAFSSGVSRLIMARYLLTYQGDRRKINVPTRGVWGPQGDTLLLTDQPITGIGPWFSFDRTGYQRTQMAEMRRAGIDVALTQWGGVSSLGSGPAATPANAAIMDDKALLVLVSALRELAAENLPAPRLALWLDTSAPAKADLSTPAGQEALYQTIKRWFDLVPPELRAKATLPIASGATRAYPVVLSDGGAFANAGSDVWEQALREKFARDFGTSASGATLLFVGAKGFDANALSLAATLAPGEGGGKGSGPISTYVVQPGREDGVSIVPRNEGDTYTQAWEAVFAAKPIWVIIDSWNDWGRATEIAPSRQYGPHFTDLTRIFTVQATGLPPRAVRFPETDTPRQMRPGQVVTATVAVQNAGATPLRSDENIFLSYKWKQNGQVVGENLVPLPLIGIVLPTQTQRLPIGLVAAVQDAATGKLTPLVPGEYSVEFDLFTQSATGDPKNPKRDYFSALPTSDGPLVVPVSIVAGVPDTVEFGATTLPTILTSGADYAADVRLRWMGDTVLTPDQAALTYQILSDDGKNSLLTGTVRLFEPLFPGQWQTIKAVVHLGDGTGAIPPACPELKASGGASGYKIRWIVTRTQAVEAIGGERVETIAVYPEGDEARIAATPPAAPLQAGTLATVPVTVANRGATVWKVGEVTIAPHWYYTDGAEAAWKGNAVNAALPHDIKPGESVTVSCSVRVPNQDGDFVLAFDLLRGTEAYFSARPVTRTGDLALLPVRVRGGNLAFVDLAKFYNTDGTSGEDKAARTGDLDGKGDAFPVESFPPDGFGLVAYLSAANGATSTKNEPNPAPYPSGYYSEWTPSARVIGFRYAPETQAAKNAVACAGQTLPLVKLRGYALHVAALATGGSDRDVPLLFRYKDGTTETVTRSIGDWNRAPGESEPVAALTRKMRTKTGDTAQLCVLRHVVYPVAGGKELESVTLPNDDRVKIFALTLER